MGATARPAIGPLLACWASWLVLMAGLAHGMAPELSRVYPSGGQRGTDLVVRCEGKFPWPVRVVAPGITVVPQTESGNLRVSIPANVPSDRVWIRLFNEQGASQAVPFLIGSLAEVGEEEPNDRTANAQHVAAPVTVNGRLQAGGDVDLFTVPLDKGETLVAALDAHTRLGSPMDAVVQIVGPDGFVVADNHDDLGLDPRRFDALVSQPFRVATTMSIA